MQIQDHVPLAPLHTFSIRNSARRIIFIETEQDLHQLYHEGVFQEPFLILGEGSNTIFLTSTDKTIIRIALPGVTTTSVPPSLPDQQISETTKASNIPNAWVTAGAGVHWDQLVQWAVDHDLGGIENLSLIPGTCGAAPVQNIGAYGVELSDVFHSLRCYDTRTGELKTMVKEECEFEYRNSVFKRTAEEGGLNGRIIILSITLALTKFPDYEPVLTYQGITDQLSQQGLQSNVTPALHQIRSAVCSIRNSKLPDPSVVPNSGSFFKNPIISAEKGASLLQHFSDLPYYPVDKDQVKIPAGWLIERAGWRGVMSGPVGTWPKQALVLIQNGDATGLDLVRFVEKLKNAVREKFQIELEPEVNLIGMEDLISHA